MCRMKSMILLKDDVFCPDYDSHSNMLGALKIKDDKRIPNFVKIEITPPDDDMSRPVEEWEYLPDQDKFPDWYVREVDEPRCREALKEWASEHIFTSGEHEVHEGVYYAYGNSIIKASENAKVVAWGNSMVEAWGDSEIKASENAEVEAWGNAKVEAWGSVPVVMIAEVK